MNFPLDDLITIVKFFTDKGSVTLLQLWTSISNVINFSLALYVNGNNTEDVVRILEDSFKNLDFKVSGVDAGVIPAWILPLVLEIIMKILSKWRSKV